MKISTISALGLAALTWVGAAKAADDKPWIEKSSPLVIDAYELNIIDWEKMTQNKRIAGFISKASDGLPEVYNCRGKHNGDTVNHCRTMWRKYAVSRELYQTRRMLAKASGMLWGAYHLGRPGNPVDQANHFLDYATPGPDDMMVLDIESLDARQFMSLDDAETFVRHIKARTGRYPVLYTNHDTARYIATHREDYALLSRLPLWYARYKPEIKGVFPMGNWDNYFLWQFSTASNCDERDCPIRIEGTLSDIDVNTVPMKRGDLARVWKAGWLLPEKPPALQYLVSAEGVLGSTALAAPGYGRVGLGATARQAETITALNYQDF